MRLGIVGIGKMGAGIARRLRRSGHEIVIFDSNSQALAHLTGDRLETASSLPNLVQKLEPRPLVWLMVPSGPAVDETLAVLSGCTPTPVTIIDGGNSDYKATIQRYHDLEPRGIGFVDVGTSGGVRGETDGYCLMIGGDASAVEPLIPIFESLAPGPERGWGHVGPPGAGHFVKMMHNGIEYGMMQAMAEGFAVLERRDDFDLDLAAIAALWNEGSVIRSWLLELAQAVFSRDRDLQEVGARVDDSGEGRWAVREAIDLNVAAPVITDSLIARIQSRDSNAFSNRLLSALRHEFGGHQSGNGS